MLDSRSIAKVTEAFAGNACWCREAGPGCGTLHQVALTGDTAAEASVPLLQAPALQLLPGLFIYPSGTVRTFTA